MTSATQTVAGDVHLLSGARSHDEGMDFEEEFRGVREISSRSERGRELERLITNLCNQSGFVATLNARAASPRQSDLFASFGGEHYVFEVKWESVPAGVPEIDDLRLRLQETPPGVIGVLISMSGFTQSAIKRVEAKRAAHPVLLV